MRAGCEMRAAPEGGCLRVRCAAAKDGGPDRDQTDDLVVANDALYQLSYRPPEEGQVLGKAPSQVNTNFRPSIPAPRIQFNRE